MIAHHSLATLVERWREVAAMLRSEGFTEGAQNKERCAAELEAVLQNANDELLSIAQASRESGYGEEHLRRHLRQNPQLNAGRKHKPLIRRRDLPRKPKRPLVEGGLGSYNARADAQSLLS